MSETCVVPGCPNERWAGPNGTNNRLTRCEEHQKAYWRAKKSERQTATGPQITRRPGRRADKSRCCVEGCPNPRHVQPGGNVLSYCLEHSRERQNEYSRRYLAKRAEVAAPSVRTAIRVSKKVAKPPTRQPVKVLLLNSQTRQMVHIEGQIVLDTPLPDDPLEAELLLETYEDYIVIEQGARPQPQAAPETRPAQPIPVRVFVELEVAARRAAEFEDWVTFQAINNRIADIGGELVWRDGDLFLKGQAVDDGR